MAGEGQESRRRRRRGGGGGGCCYCGGCFAVSAIVILVLSILLNNYLCYIGLLEDCENRIFGIPVKFFKEKLLKLPNGVL